MRAIATIATGNATYLQLALNLGLSVKANSDIQTVLLHTNDAMADLKWTLEQIDRRFGFAFDKKVAITIKEENAATPLEQAHYIKLTAYETLKNEGYTEVILLDADTLLIPSKSPDTWFNEITTNFSAYCNAEFDFKTGKSSHEGYTYWCDPLEAQDYFGLTGKMPQINASFIYFKFTEGVKRVFDTAQDIWNTISQSEFKHEKHNGSKTEEMCLNLACALTQTYPHKVPYQPIYFQYQHEEHNPAYAMQYYNAISMAGNIVHTPDLLAYYNQLCRYYRSAYGINESFVFTNETKKPKDSPIVLPFNRRTLWRRGELPNSEAGIFNPSAIMHQGKLLTIYRKEKSMEMYSHKYTHTTAVPHLCVGDNEGSELEILGFEANERLEDFRLFRSGDFIAISHTVVTNMTNDSIESHICISTLDSNSIRKNILPKLPVSKNATEKNWVFFTEDTKPFSTLWCIYSLSPYKIFKTIATSIFDEVTVTDPKIKWWHHNRFICNSTNPILVDDSYLMFFHTKDAGVYSHGACLIDKETKEITHYLRNGLSLPFNGEGLQKNLLYVSGAVYLEKENTIRVLAGEGDSHSIYFDFNKDVLMNEIKKYKA